jgi:hypothetical protein
MDLLNNIKKYDLKLCQILSHNKEDYLSYILAAYLDTNIHQHYLSYKKLEDSDRYAFAYEDEDYRDSLKYIGVTFPFVIGHTYIHVYKSLEVKFILSHSLYIRQKLEIRNDNTIDEFLEIGGYKKYRKYSQQRVDFIRQKDHNLIWASRKKLSKRFDIKYEL